MAKDKKPGFGQGSGSDLVDAMIAAEPIKNLPTALKVELNKYLKSIGKKDGGPAAPIMPEKAKKIRKSRTSKMSDKTDALSREQMKAIGYSEAQLKKMGMMYGGKVKKMAGGGCVMSGRGGKFKGIS